VAACHHLAVDRRVVGRYLAAVVLLREVAHSREAAAAAAPVAGIPVEAAADRSVAENRAGSDSSSCSSRRGARTRAA